MTTLLVLVPRLESRATLTIDHGSGIVSPGSDETGGMMVWFEGNRYEAENLRTFEERVKQAAGRLSVNYPTIARARFAATDFLIVGTYTFSPDWRVQRLEITDQATLDAWLAGQEVR